MHCREVKRRLNETGELSREVREHLESCPDCAREATAARLLAGALASAKSAESLPATPMATLRARVVAREHQEYREEKSKMSILKHQFQRRPKFSAAVLAAVCVLLFVTLVPFSYERTVGYEISFNNLPAGADYSQTVAAALKTLGYENASVSASQSAASVDYIITGLRTRQAAREAAAAFASITGTDVRPRITAVNETVSGSLYAQVRDGLIRIEIDSTGKSDAEIASEIETRLAEHGFSNTQVQVSTTPGGERQMQIFIGDDGSDPDKQTEQRIELKMDSGDAQERIEFQLGAGVDDSEIQRIVADNQNLSDAELEALIEQKLAEKGLSGADVTVQTSADGKRDIDLKLEKQEWHTDN